MDIMFRIPTKSRIALLFLISILIAITGCNQSSKNVAPQLEANFQNPPESAKPRVWWHWMNGNITKDGIRKDLEWMHRTDIGGFQNFDAALMTPQIVEKRLIFMTPEWKDAFRFTTELADSLGLEMAIAGSPGWSESGGPWVPPAEGMKKYVWSELTLEGGASFSGKLPHPPVSTGPFQNLAESSGFSLNEGNEPKPEYYADAAVIAYKIPEADRPFPELNPRITSSGGHFTIKELADGDLASSSTLPSAPPGEKSWIQFEFEQPQTFYSITMVGGGNPGRFGFGRSSATRMLESSDDGRTFTDVVEIETGGVTENTISFPPVSAKYFRVTIKTPELQGGPDPLGGLFGDLAALNRGPSGAEVAEIVLHNEPRINHFEEKAGFSTITDAESYVTPEISPPDAIQPADVMNLTGQMSEDGTLDWTTPEGKWKIIRFGYTLTGHQNSPASPEATGLEVDKLNPDFVRKYFNNYLDQYKDATGGLMGARGLQYIITDSWEAGTANWTDLMIDEFNKRNSYEIYPWLPVLTGRIVESSEASEKFLWDFRNTLGAMLTEYHYNELSSILKERGMGRYTESHESGRAFIGDGMEVKKEADIPMSATWTPGGFGGRESDGVAVRHETDIRESASVAHIYGQNLVAAESLTAIGNTWAYSPQRLKSTADFMLASGLNRFVIHTSVHQPVDDKIPGLGLGPFGQWFTRHETWAEEAKPWVDYLARSSYMLQQGTFVADLIYIYGQGTNLTALFGTELPPIPEGFNYDFLNAGAVPKVLSVKNGRIVAGAIMNYGLLALDTSARYMTLPVLKKIQELAVAGAVVMGAKPINTPSLNDDENEFSEISNQLWPEEKGVTQVGSGKVYAGYSIAEVLNDMQIEPDFTYSPEDSTTRMKFVHRSLGMQDIFWVNTENKESSVNDVSFRISGMEPEVWDPVSGEIRPVSYSMENGRTNVVLPMEPEDALFVLFMNKTKTKSYTVPEMVENPVATLSGPWMLKFQEERGAPDEAVFEDLSPWNTNEDPGIKYFSGTASYSKELEVPADWISADSELWLDLGEVKNLAEVFVNGKSLGITWKEPFRVNLDDALQAGLNQVTIQVTNLWVNRLIGDQQPGVTDPVTYTTQAFYRADSPLLPSGLLGPVMVVSISSVKPD